MAGMSEEMEKSGNLRAIIRLRVGNSGVASGMPAAHRENWRSVGAQQELAHRTTGCGLETHVYLIDGPSSFVLPPRLNICGALTQS